MSWVSFKNNLTYELFAIHNIYISKLTDRSRGRPEGSLLNSYYIKV